MNIDQQIRSLEKSGRVIVRFFSDLDEQQMRWKETPARWSLLEILAHLCDEERDDFRQRVQLTLRDPSLEWPPIDPEKWVRERDYNSMDINYSVSDFRQEREKSLEWLKGLSGADWDRAKVHPVIGTLRAGDLLVSWVAHDLLHLRQAVNTALARQMTMTGPYSTRYSAP